MKLDHFGRKWTFSCFRVGNGSKQFGVHFWWNKQRAGLEIHFWTWMLQIMREW